MSSLRERQQEVRMAAIVDAMYDLLVRKGYAATSMDDVATQLGISKATVYLHFKSKAELALAVIIRNIESATEAIQTLDPALPAIERVRRSLQTGIRHRAAMGASQIELPPALYADPAFQAARRDVAKAGSALIREAQRSGDIRGDLAATLIQEFVSNIFNMDFERLTRDRANLDSLAEQVIDLVMTAIRP
jgi:AcrR family transcriptional regulator